MNNKCDLCGFERGKYGCSCGYCAVFGSFWTVMPGTGEPGPYPMRQESKENIDEAVKKLIGRDTTYAPSGKDLPNSNHPKGWMRHE